MQDHFDISLPPPAEPEPEPSLEGTIAPKLEMEINEETEEVDPQFVYPEGKYEEDELDEIEIPDMPVKKTKLADADVFSAPQVNPVKEKKVRKKRKPMTPEQLEKLAEARKKAFATKALKKKERDEMKVLEQKVAKKKKAKQHQEIIDELSDEELPESFKQKDKETPKLARTESVKVRPAITQEDLMMAVASGVETYDRKRKAEKKVKKEKKAQEDRQTDNVRKITGALNLGTSPWDQFLR